MGRWYRASKQLGGAAGAIPLLVYLPCFSCFPVEYAFWCGVCRQPQLSFCLFVFVHVFGSLLDVCWWLVGFVLEGRY